MIKLNIHGLKNLEQIVYDLFYPNNACIWETYSNVIQIKEKLKAFN